MNETLTQILESRLVAIIRGADPGQVLDIAQALYDGGIRLVEVTLNSENALDAINEIVTQFNGRMLAGAGTVLNAESAQDALQAGAKFIISPTLDESTIQATKRGGGVSIPGAFSPTEILTAWRLGADIVKVFPATAGPDFIKDIRGPLGHIPLMPTGGITLENIGAFRKAGAVAFGIGSALVNTKQGMTSQVLDQITTKARQFAQAVKEQ